MEAIKTIFPHSIPSVDVQYNLMMGMKKIHGRPCLVEEVSTSEEGVLYSIQAETAMDFYKIGMIASAMIRNNIDSLTDNPYEKA